MAEIFTTPEAQDQPTSTYLHDLVMVAITSKKLDLVGCRMSPHVVIGNRLLSDQVNTVQHVRTLVPLAREGSQTTTMSHPVTNFHQQRSQALSMFTIRRYLHRAMDMLDLDPMAIAILPAIQGIEMSRVVPD